MRIYLASLLLVSACAQQVKTAVDDDFSSLAGQDEKSDAFSYRMKILGSLDYGQTSASAKYSKTPRYRAYKFSGQPGDQVDVWVRSPDGDAVAWVLDNGFHVLATNDDADATTLDAHVVMTLPAAASATHYIVYRDYGLASTHFTVALAGGPAYDTSCTQDSDCVAVPTGGCCPDGTLAAVSAGAEADYAAATACTAVPHPLCPQHVIDDRRVAQCDFATNHCAMIAPEDIHCGGFIAHPHSCPTGYACHFSGVPDVGGSCVAP